MKKPRVFLVGPDKGNYTEFYRGALGDDLVVVDAHHACSMFHFGEDHIAKLRGPLNGVFMKAYFGEGQDYQSVVVDWLCQDLIPPIQEGYEGNFVVIGPPGARSEHTLVQLVVGADFHARLQQAVRDSMQ